MTTTEALAAATELERTLAYAAGIARELAAFYEAKHGPDDGDARHIQRVEREVRDAERTVSYRTRVLRELVEIEEDR